MSQMQSELERKLKRALNQGDFVSFKRLVKGGVDVNATHWFDSTLLHEAVQINNPDMVKLLLEYNANVNSKNKGGRTALHLACRGGIIDIVKLLLKHEADVNVASDDCQMPLHCAVWRKHTEIVKLLIAAGADVNAIVKATWMPLYWAVKQGSTDIVKNLVENGALIEESSSQQRKKGRPLVESIVQCHNQIAHLLISHGATTDQLPSRICDILKRDNKAVLHFKPLHEKENLVEHLINCACFATENQLLDFINAIVCHETDRVMLFLENQNNMNQSLSSICRSKVRKLLLIGCGGKSIYRAVQDLQLPHVLKDYLLFSGQFTVFVKDDKSIQ